METRICRLTNQPFELSNEQSELYRSFDLPLPQICLQERIRQQLAFRNESQFFWSSCKATGSRIYSAYDSQVPFPIVAVEYWEEGNVDPLAFGIEYDPNKLFFEQLLELWVKVPRPALRLKKSSGSQIAHNVRSATNCSMAFDVYHSDNCHFIVAVWDSRYCVDCLNISSCEFCYECINCYFCQRTAFAENCYDCHDSRFISNCSHCKNCLFCTNLDSKEYYIFNQPVTPAEYKAKLQSLRLDTQQGLESAKQLAAEFMADKPLPHIYADKTQNISGNYLYHCVNAIESFECRDSENLAYCNRLVRAKNCLDGFGFGNDLEHSAQFVSVGGGAKNIINCVECWGQISDLTYCAYCSGSEHLFACVGLEGKEFCIFNRQYEKAEYFALTSIIKETLKSQGVWGLFFPGAMSGHSYNRSAAGVYMPLNKYQAAMLGYAWDETEDAIKPSQLLGDSEQSPETRFAELPQSLDVLRNFANGNEVYLCEITGRPFRYIPQEIKMYHELNIAPPTRSYEQRYRERLTKVAPRKLLNRVLEGETVSTAFPADWSRPVVKFSKWQHEVLR